VDANVRNVVVLTGDVHRTWANDVKVDYKDPAVGWNPHLKFYNDIRGYVHTKITKDAKTGWARGKPPWRQHGATASTRLRGT